MQNKKRIAVLSLAAMMAAVTITSFLSGPSGRLAAFAAVASGGNASSGDATSSSTSTTSTDDSDDDEDVEGVMPNGTAVTVNTYADQTCVITGVDSEDTSITIQAKVKANGKVYKVVAIGSGALDWCPNVTSVILPTTLTDVEEEAFDGPENLNTIIFKSTGKLRFQSGSLTGTDSVALIRFTSKNVVVVVNNNAFADVASTDGIKIRTNKKMSAQLLNRVKSQFKKAGFSGTYV